MPEKSVTIDTKRKPVPDWAEDMARIPFNPNAERAAFNFAHNPCGMHPRDYEVPEARPRPERGERPLVNPDVPAHPTPGVTLLDRQLQAETLREAQAQAAPSKTEKLLEVAQAVMQQQTEIMKFLAGQKK